MKSVLPLALLGLFGCAPSISGLQKHLRVGAYDKALIETKGDPQMQKELAALLLERAAAADSSRSSEVVDFLSGAGAPGKRALKRLAGSPNEPSALLAKIALKRTSFPDAEEQQSFFESELSDVRAAAARAWASKLDSDHLQAMLIDKDPRVRRWTADAICVQARKAGKNASLRDALRKDPDSKVRTAAARCPKALGDSPILILKNALKDEKMGVQLAAIQGFSELGDDTARSIIEEIAAGPLDELTVAAAAELSRLGSELGNQRMNAALADERTTIRQAALLRMERAGFENRDEILVRALDDGAPEVVILVAGMLASREDLLTKVTEALKRIVDMDVSPSAQARDMLAVLGDEDSLKAVREILEGDEPEEIKIVLGRVQRATALKDLFVQLMAHDSDDIRLGAAKAVLLS